MSNEDRPPIIFVCFGGARQKVTSLYRNFSINNDLIVCDTLTGYIVFGEFQRKIGNLNERNDFSGFYFGLKFLLDCEHCNTNSGIIFINDSFLTKKISPRQKRKIGDLLDHPLPETAFFGQVDKARNASSFLPPDRRYVSTYFFAIGAFGISAFTEAYEKITDLDLERGGYRYINDRFQDQDRIYARNVYSIIDGSNKRVKWSGLQKYGNVSEQFKMRKFACVLNEHLMSKLVRNKCNMISVINISFFGRLLRYLRCFL